MKKEVPSSESFAFGRAVANRVQQATGSTDRYSQPGSVEWIGKISGLYLTGASEMDEEMMQQILTVAAQYKGIGAERFIEGLVDVVRSNEKDGSAAIDSKQFGRLTEAAFDQFGLSVGGRFAGSYVEVVQLGLHPDEYFDHVAQSVEDGGRIFAGAYAKTLPSVLELGCDPSDFREATVRIKNKALQTIHPNDRTKNPISPNKVAISFMHEAPTILSLPGQDIATASEQTCASLDRIGRDATYYGMPGMQILAAVAGYSPEEYLDGVDDAVTQTSRACAGWYAAGLKRLAEAYPGIKADTYLENFQQKRVTSIGEVSDETKQQLSPLDFKRAFEQVFEESGKGAAIFFSRSFDPSAITASLQLLEDARDRLGKSLLSYSAWQIQQINSSSQKAYTPADGMSMLSDLVKLHKLGGEALVMKMIKYNRRARGKVGYVSGIRLPSNMTHDRDGWEVDDINDSFYAQILRETQVSSVSSGEEDVDLILPEVDEPLALPPQSLYNDPPF